MDVLFLTHNFITRSVQKNKAAETHALDPKFGSGNPYAPCINPNPLTGSPK